MVILITGANRGLGFELAKLFAGRGHMAVAGAFEGNSLDDLNALKEKYPDNVRIIPLDITSGKSVEDAVRKVNGAGRICKGHIQAYYRRNESYRQGQIC